jgi:hypothetical protein
MAAKLAGLLFAALFLAVAQARSIPTNTGDADARKRILTLDADARIYLWKGFLTPGKLTMCVTHLKLRSPFLIILQRSVTTSV